MIDEGLKVFEVNLAVSNVCNANCLFCPRSFVKHDNPFMSLETVDRIMTEVSTPEFKAEHPVVHTVLSENGEPFLNPDILDIFRCARKAGLYITIFTNFALLDKDKAKAIIDEHLVDNIHVNVDGLTSGSYRAVKGLDLERVGENIRRFAWMRDAAKSPIRILCHVISHYTYTKAVQMAYGIPPVKGNGHPYAQDGPETVRVWQSMLNPATDGVGEDSVMFWAERYNDKPLKGDFQCPNIGRVRHVAYINPDGDLYGCCFDMGNDLKVGNIFQTSLLEALHSDKRKDLISKLEARRFDEIGFPCTRVDACGGMNRGDIR